jgi:hypothetical protein
MIERSEFASPKPRMAVSPFTVHRPMSGSVSLMVYCTTPMTCGISGVVREPVMLLRTQPARYLPFRPPAANVVIFCPRRDSAGWSSEPHCVERDVDCRGGWSLVVRRL